VPSLLLIEDDSEIRVLLERFLTRAGFTVSTAADGEVGMKAYLASPTDIVVTDGLLPKKSGYEIAAGIRKSIGGKVPGIVMITAAFKSPQARKDALDGGVDAFFTKPFVLTDLLDKLREILVAKGKPPPVPMAVAPAPGSSTDFAPPPPTDPRARAEAAPLPTSLKVSSPIEVARFLSLCGRARLSGVVVFEDGASELKLAFLRGVVVGASDNLREHLLGERLWKQGKLSNDQMRALNARIQSSGERVAEALLALGFCSAADALALMEEQGEARIRRALLWTGAVKLVVDDAAAHAMAVAPVPLHEVVFAFALEPTHTADADRFVALKKSDAVERARDFNMLLAALCRKKPDAQLPGVLAQTRTMTVAEAARSSSALELYAAWFAGLVRLPSDPPADPRSLPDVMRAEIKSALVDVDLVSRICTALVRARNRNYYEILDAPVSVSSEGALQKLVAMANEVGPSAVAGRPLGPATVAARELWQILDDAYRTFMDPQARQLYDAMLPPPPAPPSPRPANAPAVVASKNEDAFLEGTAALESGDVARALACFQAAAASRPDDPEYQSYLGWAQVLAGDKTGMTRLLETMRDHPQAMRPLFFLGLVAAQDGDSTRAKKLLAECVRRAPLDVEVAAALHALS
jgi:CheY-like chemotaxis protein